MAIAYRLRDGDFIQCKEDHIKKGDFFYTLTTEGASPLLHALGDALKLPSATDKTKLMTFIRSEPAEDLRR